MCREHFGVHKSCQYNQVRLEKKKSNLPRNIVNELKAFVSLTNSSELGN